MNELFYFSSLGLMIKVDYLKETNSLRYASHREMENDERMIAERYIMVEMAPKTNYYLKDPATFIYLGTDARLKKKLAAFQQEDELQSSPEKEKEISASVHSLINVSMRNYYFEKIGELIVAARRELKDGRPYAFELANLKQQMSDLMKAYNVYADHQVTLDEIIPPELKAYWPGLEEARCHTVPSS